jgi:hypothetical protein
VAPVLSHKQLCTYVEASMKSIHETWRRNKLIDPFLVAWPCDPIPDKKGILISAPCILPLTADRSKWGKLRIAVVDRTNAYALLQVEQREVDVRAILETTEGTRCWVHPIARSGDIVRLGSARVSDNTELLNLLWFPN